LCDNGLGIWRRALAHPAAFAPRKFAILIPIAGCAQLVTQLVERGSPQANLQITALRPGALDQLAQHLLNEFFPAVGEIIRAILDQELGHHAGALNQSDRGAGPQFLNQVNGRRGLPRHLHPHRISRHSGYARRQLDSI
jgi:hypothetical protein